jgi:polymerase delta-interacting protein 2
VQNNVYWWRYCIRLENLGEATVQLRQDLFSVFLQRAFYNISLSRGIEPRN